MRKSAAGKLLKKKICFHKTIFKNHICLGGSVIIPWFGYRIAMLSGILVFCAAPILSYFALNQSTLTALVFS